MTEKNRKILEQAIQSLPEHEPDPLLWSKISSMMDFDEKFSGVRDSLPEHEPADDLWNRIDAELEESTEMPAQEEERKIVKIGRTERTWLRYAISMAATLIFCVLLWQLSKQPGAAVNETGISYSVETIQTEEPMFQVMAQDEDDQASVHSMLNATCLNLPEKCETEEVKELKSQLEMLDDELKALEEDARKYGSGPELIKNQVKIENLKARITKELVQILLS